MARVFINYRRQDSEGYVGRMYDHLLKTFDADDIFMDVHNIDPGADFVLAIEKAVADCAVLLCVIGSHWLTVTDEEGERRIDAWNDFVRIEIESALKLGKVLVPVLVGGAKVPSPDKLPEPIKALARRNAITITHQNFAADMERIAAVIKRYAPANESFKPDTSPEVSQQKFDALKILRDDVVGASDSPLYQHRTDNRYFPVLGAGNPDANILFMGEAPGKNEGEQGVPFVGASGDFLDEMLDEIGIRRDNVYITNLVLDVLPENRAPRINEVEFYRPFADRVLDIIRPAVIVTLGRFATEYLLKKLDLPEKRQKISQLHGKLIKASMPYGDIHVIPMYHPAYALYYPKKKPMLMQDFEKLRLFI